MKLIVIEGVDGSGKSTQLKLLKEYFTEKGFGVRYLHFPRTEEPYFGELIARFLRGEFGSLNEVDPYLVAMLYAGDRKDAAEMINGWLGSNKIVLLDRYTFSNIAYQCAKLKEQALQDRLMKWILSLEFEHFKIPEPDLNIFIDVPFSFTRAKLTSYRHGNDRDYLNGNRDIHEKNLDFQRKVRDIYLRIARSDERLVVINCVDNKGKMKPPGIISDQIIRIITDRKLI